MKTRIRKPKFQEKVVFWVNKKVDTLYSDSISESFEFVENFINIMLKKENINSNMVFIGGKKDALILTIASLLDNYKYKDLNIENYSEIFEDDVDFE